MAILVVDDDELMLTLIEISLRRKGYPIARAHNAGSALQLLEMMTPELVVLDIMMPDMNGLELCRLIRSRAQTSTTPIIFLSSMSDKETARSGIAAGANVCLNKSEIATLSSVIDHLLSTRPRDANPSGRTEGMRYPARIH